MTAARVSRAPARGTVFRLYPLASPSGPLYIERVFLLRSCINRLIHHLHLYRSLYSNSSGAPLPSPQLVLSITRETAPRHDSAHPWQTLTERCFSVCPVNPTRIDTVWTQIGENSPQWQCTYKLNTTNVVHGNAKRPERNVARNDVHVVKPLVTAIRIKDLCQVLMKITGTIPCGMTSDVPS